MILEMTALAFLSPGALPTKGSSETAKYLQTELEGRREKLIFAWHFLGSGRREVVEELRRVAEDSSSPGWDGYGALPVSPETISNARHFLNSLPGGISFPSVGAEPDGQVTFEWYRSPRRTLSVSVSPENDLHYAALIGASKAYGTEPFLGEVPHSILTLIRRVNSE